MTERKSLSKRIRFEIFKRDGFKCAYCGAPPTAGVLHVDHITPVAEGGTDDPENLVTSCPGCNLGKSAVPLTHQAIPSFDPEAALEHAEQLRSWAEAQRDVRSAKKSVEQEMVNLWCSCVGTDSCSWDVPKRLVKLSAEWPMPKLVEALEIVGSKDHLLNDTHRLRYLYGILRNWKEVGEVKP